MKSSYDIAKELEAEVEEESVDFAVLINDCFEARCRERAYFNRVSKSVKEIKNHIHYDEDCVLMEKMRDEDGDLLDVSSVDFRSAALSDHEGERDWCWIDLEVQFCESEYRYPSRSCRVKVPIDLEKNFTQEKFDAWIAKLRKERDDKVKEQEIEDLKRLMRKYPDEAVKLY
jgi:hypothetical protein